MYPTTTSRIGQLIHRLGQIWHELDHAQRRLLEIRTGVPNLTRPEDRSRLVSR